MPTLRDELEAIAKHAGFERMGVARAERLHSEGERLTAWLRAGHHASMAWMAEHLPVRIDPRHEKMLAGARSVIVLATRYSRRPVPDALGVRIAAYARGRDYHRVLEKRMRPIVATLRKHGFDARSAVDSKPVYERAWAVRAGLGFVGKNSCLIIPGLGSHAFLAAVVTTAELPCDEPMSERCGTCRRCLDVCPTKAFIGPRELDSRRCISYHTIENPEPAPEHLRSRFGAWAFGCDECQDVCPFNQGDASRRPATLDAQFYQETRWEELRPADFLRIDASAFDKRFAGNPLRRAGRAQMARNVAVALANGGAKARRYLPVLEEAASQHDESTVREAALWAIEKINGP